jgi:ComF family protein
MDTTEPAQQTSGLFPFLLDLLFPPRCWHCGRVDTQACDRCQQQLAHIPITNVAPPPLPPMTGLATTQIHRGQLQQAIQALKYEQALFLAWPLAGRLAEQVKMLGWRVDAVGGVPLHHDRYRERGYNQAKVLAECVAELLGLPEVSGALHRDSYTRPQVGLGREARLQNVAGAFRAEPDIVRGQRILVIDDVLTTGATLQACTQAVATSGAAAVFGLTITAAKKLI